jgi:hypothetical protein
MNQPLSHRFLNQPLVLVIKEVQEVTIKEVQQRHQR